MQPVGGEVRNERRSAGNPLGVAPDLSAAAEEIFALVSDRLETVEVLFRRNLESPVGIVEEIGTFVGASGGKRVRPILHLLCARMCRYAGPHDVLLGTVLEFIHLATLIHDDIIDEATTRRGRPSVNQQWGNNVTVLFGDYLYAKALEMALGAGSLRIMETLADATLRMTEGEMLQTRYAGRVDLTVAEHLDLVERKTAALFGACCETAGMLAAAGEAKEQSLRRYGRNLGMAFQVVDDLLDFTGDAEVLGKPAASDLAEGKVTLPVIDLLTTGTRRDRELVDRIVANEGADADEIARLRARLQESGALERARARARAYAAAASAELASFPNSRARRALATVPDLLVFRDR